MNKEFEEVLLTYFGASQKTLFDLQQGTKPSDVTQIQYNILEYLYFADKSTTSSVAQCLYLSMPNTSREIKKLVDLDYIRREYDQKDKRKHYVLLSDPGKNLMNKAISKTIKKADEKYGTMSIEEQEDLTDMLKIITEKLFS